MNNRIPPHQNQPCLRAWFVWGLATIYVLYQFLLQTSISVMIPELAQAFSINFVQVGLMSSCFFYSYIVLQMPAGLVIDRFGARHILISATLCCAVAVLIFSQTTSLTIAYLMRFVMGISVAPAFVAALFLAGKWFPSHQFPLLVGLTEALGMLGGALGQIILAPSVTAFGWRMTLLIFALIAFLLALLIGFIVHDTPPQVEKTMFIPAPKFSMLQNLWSVIKLPQAWINGLYAGLMFALIQAFASLWAVPFLSHVYLFSLTQSAVISSMIFLGSVLGAPFLGWLAENLNKYKFIMALNALLTVLILIVVVYVRIPNILVLVFLFFMLGFLCSSYMLPFSVIRERISVKNRATAMGFVNMMCIMIGAPILQPLIGKLLNGDFVAYQIAFLPLVFSLLLAFGLVFFVKSNRA